MQPKFFSQSATLAIVMVSTLGLLMACGKPNVPVATETPSTATDNATTVATQPVMGNGEKVYQTSCRVCHDTGNLNSPRVGDNVAWQARIAQGKDTLYAHAITGFTGKSGVMPPRGNSTAPDADIKAAVDYMVAKSQ